MNPPPAVEVEQVTDSYIRQVVEQASEQQQKLVTHRDIMKTVCKVYGLRLKELSSPSRRRDRAEARAVATRIVAERPHLTLVELSRLLKRNVSSLSHCVRRMKERLTYDQQLQERVEAVRRLLDARKAQPRQLP